MPKISIVIPIYNAEKFIVHLLDKIYDQTLTDFELICINDGSTDDTKNILENYALKHNNMFVINQKNCGIGCATNVGINRAKGKYLWQLDHDDSLTSNEAFKILYTTAEKYNLDILTFNFATETHESKLIQPINKVISGKEYLLGTFHPALWSKFCKLSYINNINFRLKEHLRFVDTEALPRLLINATRMMHIKDVLYFFRTHTNKESVSDNIMNIESAKAFYETAVTYTKIINQIQEPKLLEALKRRRRGDLISTARILGSINSNESIKIYAQLLKLNLSTFESFLVKNEYKFFYYRYVKKASKIRHPLIYIIRRFRKLII